MDHKAIMEMFDIYMGARRSESQQQPARPSRSERHRARREAHARNPPALSFHEAWNAPLVQDATAPIPQAAPAPTPQSALAQTPQVAPDQTAQAAPVQTRQAAPVQTPAATSSPDESVATLRAKHRPKGEKLPFVEPQAKMSTLHDLRASWFSCPTAHPGGIRHPRVLTLIGRDDMVPAQQRGTLPRPTAASQVVLPRRARRHTPRRMPRPPQAQPRQAAQAQQARRSRRTQPYANSRRLSLFGLRMQRPN
ncbi:uncharacterized protein PGTG_15516 [Puccinia graminis f. sp. tritici CRL 75-36-700-3]|uniref:Uncharacterized protein n=1 Tax=Puccinia graminis f. sp. tritici (strain CRL 75-36-700-3 / race SCCL) TaxID=418459 RepID=E3KYE6_PUCGT|nr:uncharacterized protein PGTG_15516 [Puccinia graminis f. sp. tritici CRL 75-36-700-3]EFP89337.1 hypothetical protein PGTG_15516 [Puccinia graminis f. sp. tritici CRL 75-36-700-3]